MEGQEGGQPKCSSRSGGRKELDGGIRPDSGDFENHRKTQFSVFFLFERETFMFVHGDDRGPD